MRPIAEAARAVLARGLRADLKAARREARVLKAAQAQALAAPGPVAERVALAVLVQTDRLAVLAQRETVLRGRLAALAKSRASSIRLARRYVHSLRP